MGTVGGLTTSGMAAILEVTRALAAPFDLHALLAEVTRAAREVLAAERCSVWLHDAGSDELVLEVASDIRHVRVPVGVGLVGACARERRIVNVPDCYADPRFDPATDRRSGFRTRCSLTLPLIDHRENLVGVMQLLNREGGVFEASDEPLAAALAAQCAVALQRVRLTVALIETETLRAELDAARVVQRSTLPACMPVLAGYDAFGLFEPAAQTGGDTFDLAIVGDDLLVVLADATGHGIAPALSVTNMHAMLRMALRLGTPLGQAAMQVNNQLAETLPEDRFVTAFVGLLDPATHTLRYVSAGQGPILLWRARAQSIERYPTTIFPLGAMPLAAPRPPSAIALEPGDVLVLLSDGLYEQHDAGGAVFGEARVEQLVGDHAAALPMAALAGCLLDAVNAFAGGQEREDDCSIVLLRRNGLPQRTERRFSRRLDALDALFAFAARSIATLGADAALRSTVDLALEELFTNMVKYGGADGSDVQVEFEACPGGVEVVLAQESVDAFDVTRVPPVDVGRPLAEREPGGLGLHLVARLVEDLHYDYDAPRRRSRISFRTTSPPDAHDQRG